jgi:hypothetical protein
VTTPAVTSLVRNRPSVGVDLIASDRRIGRALPIDHSHVPLSQTSTSALAPVAESH